MDSLRGLVESHAGDPWLRASCRDVVSRIKRRSSRDLVISLVRDADLETIEELLEVADEAFTGRPFRKVRGDLTAGLQRLMKERGVVLPRDDRAVPGQRGGALSGFRARQAVKKVASDPSGEFEALHGQLVERWPFVSMLDLGDLAVPLPQGTASIPLAQAIGDARSGTLGSWERSLLAEGFRTLLEPAGKDRLPPLEDPTLARLDNLLADLEAELGPHAIPCGISARGRISIREASRLHLVVSFISPRAAPSVILPLPWRGPIRRADVERASGPNLQESPWTPAAIVYAIRLLRQQLRHDGSPLKEPLESAFALPPWHRLLDSVPEAKPAGPETELWWSLDPDAPHEPNPMLRRRGKRAPHDWLKLKRLRKTDLDHLRVSPKERVAVGLALESYAGLLAHAVRMECTASILEHLVGHPRICLEGDPHERIRFRRDRLRLELLATDAGNHRIVLKFGEDKTLSGELFDDGVYPLPNGFYYLDLSAREFWVVDASAELMSAAGRLHQGLELTPEEVPVVLPWLLERAEGLSASVDGGPPLDSSELEVVLQLEWSDDDVIAVLGLCAPGVNPSFVFYPGSSGSFVAGASGATSSVRHRAPNVERDRLRVFLEALKPSGIDEHWSEEGGPTRLDLESALQVLHKVAERSDVRILWRSKRRITLRKGAVGPDALRLKIEDGLASYLLTGSIAFEGNQVALGDVLTAIRQGQGFVEITGNTFVALEEKLRSHLALVDAVAEDDGPSSVVPEAAAHRLLELARATSDVPLTPRLAELEHRVRRAETLNPAVDPTFRATLRDYQQEGFRWALRLAELGLGACLADDMGLGKTVQALAVLVARAERGPALVVAPTSVMHNWLRDAERFAPSLRVISFHGADRDLVRPGPGDMIVTSYGLLRQDQEDLCRHTFGTVVFDEAQALKTATSRTAGAARALSSEWRLALTGTPVENHAGELWSMFEVLAPGLLGSKRSFGDRFGPTKDDKEEALRRQRLALAIRPLVLRRTKKQVLEQLPPKTEVRLDLALSAEEQRLYDAVRVRALAELHDARPDDQRGQLHLRVLAVLTELRQLACHPRLYDAASSVPSSKHARLMELLQELTAEGRQVLVFSQFVRQLDLVGEALDALQISHERLVGQSSVRQRLRAIERFGAGAAPVFLVSLKAGGVGLNLTAADTVIFLDPWWNPAVEAQAEDRAHRMGQTKPVTIYRLIAKGTLEETVISLQERKRKLVDEVLRGTDRAAGMDTEGLLNLIRGSVGEDPRAG